MVDDCECGPGFFYKKFFILLFFPIIASRLLFFSSDSKYEDTYILHLFSSSKKECSGSSVGMIQCPRFFFHGLTGSEIL